MHLHFSVSISFAWATLINAQYNIYQPKNQVIFGGSALNYTNTAAAAAASYTGAAVYDPTILNPPAVPNPPIPTQVPVQLTSSGGIPNLSIPQNGGFFGFSIEMSVSNQVCESSCHSPLDALTDRRTSQWERTGGLFSTLSLTPSVNAHQLVHTGPVLEPYGKYSRASRLGPSPRWW